MGATIGALLAIGGVSESGYAGEPVPGGDKPAPVREAPLDVTGHANDDALAERVKAEVVSGSLGPHFGALSWERPSDVLVIHLMGAETGLAEADRAEMSRLLTLAPAGALRFEFGARPEVEMRARARELIDHPEAWAAGLPGRPGGGYDLKSQQIVLTIMDTDDPDGWRRAVERLRDPSVSLRIISPPSDGSVAQESRVADFAPRTGGSKLDYAGSYCTAGFNWKRWSSGETVGSTANHCSSTTFLNNGAVWGSSVLSSPNADARLLANTSPYHPSVYVGSVSTSDWRYVVAIDTAWIVGDVVALSAATTGLTTANVANPDYTLPSAGACGGGLRVVLMDRHNSAGGDSGGPWLTTRVGGDAVAHGQHIGYDMCATGGSYFMPLNTISSRLSASIYTAP